MMKKVVFLAAAAFAVMGEAASNEAAKWDPHMALENAVVDTNGVKWIDGRFLPLEGRAFDDTEAYYDRLPANVTTNVNGGVRNMKHHTSGMMFRFRTDSDFLVCKWTPWEKNLAMDHMPATGVSGIDIYRFDEKSGRWCYCSTGRISDAQKGGSVRIGWRKGEACLVNLPLYNGVRSFSLGIAPNATVEALGPRKSGVDRPVVFYGTSITHGGCASRPGLGFVNRVGRDLDVPVVGLGFSGSGWMEYEMSEHLARIDASCYVLDCLANMCSTNSPTSRQANLRAVELNYEPFIRNLRAKRPGVPIVMAEQGNVWCSGPGEKDRFAKALCEKLVAEGWKDLVYLPKDEMFTGDTEGTVDGCHPNDLGMKSMSLAYGKAVREALGMKGGADDPYNYYWTDPRVQKFPAAFAPDTIVLSNRLGRVEISRYAAQVLSYVPAGGRDVFYMPPDRDFSKCREMHGGVPVCWPWFNMQGDPLSAQHGFARYALWTLAERYVDDDLARVVLMLESSAETKKLWPFDFRLTYTITLTDRLTLDLRSENTADPKTCPNKWFETSEGFHAYFRVSDPRKVTVAGVVQDGVSSDLRGRLGFGGVTPVYSGEYLLKDDDGHTVAIAARGATSMVYWNPGDEILKPRSNRTFGDEVKFLCVEPTTLGKKAIRLAPGESRNLKMTVKAL